jgi:FMN phosphatase YigB (HAD superfamily)
MITHIFFDMHGTMIDSKVLGMCYGQERARWLAKHYEGGVDVWLKANEIVVSDWDAYHADLNFSAPDGEGMRDYYEAGYRIIRALFRCAGVKAPPRDEIQRLSLELPGIAPLSCDAFYTDVKPVIELLAKRYTLGVATHSLTVQAHATLVGGGVRDFFKGPLIGADTAEQFDKDEAYYQLAARLAQVDPSACLVVDDSPGAIEGARHADCKTIFMLRAGRPQPQEMPAADLSLTDFTVLPQVIRDM